MSRTPTAPEPSLAERARTLVEGCAAGVLATLDPVTFVPHVAPVPLTVDGAGNPVLVLPNLHPHVGHAWREPRAGIAVGVTDGRPATTRTPSVTLTGTLEPVPGLHQLDLEPRFLAAHPDAADRVISLDCSWFRLTVTTARVDAGGARAGWLAIDDYRTAEPDPLAPHAEGLIERVRELDLLDLARTLTGRPNTRTVEVLDLDRYGCEVRLGLQLPSGAWGPSTVDVRLPFPDRLDGPAEVVPTLVLMIANLRPLSGGDRPADPPDRTAAPPPVDRTDAPLPVDDRDPEQDRHQAAPDQDAAGSPGTST